MPGALARSEPTTTVSPPRPRAWRWLAVFVVVTLLHWIAAEWIERHRGVPPPVRDVHVPVQVALLKPERIEREAESAKEAGIDGVPCFVFGGSVIVTGAQSPEYLAHAIRRTAGRHARVSA